MSETRTLELPVEVYEAVERAAQASGTTPADLIGQRFGVSRGASVVPPPHKDERTEAEKQAARERFERHIGAVSLGYATGVDNESIDADLGRGYADNHEPES